MACPVLHLKVKLPLRQSSNVLVRVMILFRDLNTYIAALSRSAYRDTLKPVRKVNRHETKRIFSVHRLLCLDYFDDMLLQFGVHI